MEDRIRLRIALHNTAFASCCCPYLCFFIIRAHSFSLLLAYSTPLPQPFCEPVRLFCGCEPDKLPEEPPKELRTV